MKGFYHILYNVHLGNVTQMPRTNFSSPYLCRFHTKVGYGRAVLEQRPLKKVDNGRTLECGYTMRSPCEPYGSGEVNNEGYFTKGYSVHVYNSVSVGCYCVYLSFPNVLWSI